MTTLGDVADFMSGGTPAKDNPEYWGGEISWFSAANMRTKFLSKSDLKLTQAGLAAGSRLAPQGATLLLVRGSGLFNHIPICFADDSVAFNQDVKAICARPGVDPTYLHFVIESLRPKLEENVSLTGIGAGKFDLDFLKKLPFPLIPIEDQKEIARLVEAFDRRIELNRRTNDTLESVTRALFKDWFVDFGPTRAKVDGLEPYLTPQLWALFPDCFNDETSLPEGWELGSLGNFAAINADSWTARNHPEVVEYVDLSNTKWGNIESVTPLAWNDAPSRARRIARIGDTIVGTTRPGNGSFAYISREDLTVSTGFAVLSPRDIIYQDIVYISATRPENIDRLANLADGHGGAYPAVNPAEVVDTELPLPGDQIISAFADQVSTLRQKIERSKEENLSLARTRDLLLPKLMSGEIRLRDGEKITGEVL